MKYTEQIMKFEVTEDTLKMEAKLEDLAWLFENSPEMNLDFPNTIKRDKLQEFAKFIIERLQDESPYNHETVGWGMPFEYIFGQIMEGDESEFCIYPDYNYEDDEDDEDDEE